MDQIGLVNFLLGIIIIIIIVIALLQRKLMVFNWSLSDSKSPQVSRTLLSILADLDNAVVWMVSTCPLISKSSSPFTNPLVTIPSTPITTGITVTFMFHSFFSSLARSSLLLSSFTPLEFFTSVLADGFSLGFDWQQVSTSLQDSSQDSGRSQQCCHLDSLYPSANFQVLQVFFIIL